MKAVRRSLLKFPVLPSNFLLDNHFPLDVLFETFYGINFKFAVKIPRPSCVNRETKSIIVSNLKLWIYEDRYISIGVRNCTGFANSFSTFSSIPWKTDMGRKATSCISVQITRTRGRVRSDQEHRFGRDALAARELGRRGSTIRFVADRTPILFLVRERYSQPK